MESLPPRQASQRRASPEQTTSPNQTQARTAAAPSSSPVRSRSEDSQTLFLNSPEHEREPEPEPEPEPAHTQQQPKQSDIPAIDKDADPAVKKCWICFSDSTEDTAETSPWRDPCPCALVAHEECLLDWIADMEAPNNRRTQRGVAAPKIECPQCKSEIHLARPRNLVVDAVRAIERAGSQLITPGALTILVGIVYNSSMTCGVHSIYAVFGADDGFRILRPLILNNIRPPLDLDHAGVRDIGHRLLGITIDHLVHWRLYLGLPLITPMLILSRTSLADSLLPVLPILFFATQTHSPQDTLDFGQWPPSASLAFAVLPYLRSAYNAYYRRVWAPKEKQWLKEIQPRVREGQAEDAANADPAEPVAGDRDRDDGNIFEVRIDGGIWEDWEDEDSDSDDEGGNGDEPRIAPLLDANEALPPPPPPPAVPAEAEPMQFLGGQEREQLPGELADPPPNIADNRRRQQQQARPQPQQPGAQRNQNAADPLQQPAPAGGERRLSFSPTAIAETVLGALVFPTIAGLSGELLKLALPRSWTAVPAVPTGARVRVAAKGLLQEKWGRSLIGGCLFVVLKDCVMLYVRWKMAQMHRRRRVVDYQGKTKTVGAGDASVSNES